MESPKTMNTIALAFLGDAVYEQFIRLRILESGRSSGHADRMHKAAVHYVCAAAQAAAINSMMDSLTEEEQKLVLRARNHKIATKPKNADPITYKWATAFEALLGYLKLSGEEDRLLEIMNKAYEAGSEKRESSCV